jgi:hypothetical protein
MPRRCTVCDHPERHGIDEALVTGAPYRSVAKRFELSESAVYRHKADHLLAYLLKAKEVEEAARADDLLDQVNRLITSSIMRRWAALFSSVPTERPPRSKGAGECDVTEYRKPAQRSDGPFPGELNSVVAKFYTLMA